MRVEVFKLDEVVEDVAALTAVQGTDTDVDARIDGIVDLAGVREELRRLARAVRSLARGVE
jgi:hypothetical protein